MTREDLKARLVSAQEAIAQAFEENDLTALPRLVTGRQSDFELLAEAVATDAELKRWARSYLQRDRQLLAQATEVREAVKRRLVDLRLAKSAHRSYISEGARR